MMKIPSYDVELNGKKAPILVKETEHEYDCYDGFTPAEIAHMMNSIFHLDRKAEEHVYMASFDNKGNPLGFFFVSKGTVNHSVANSREIYIRALISGASCIALIHNHPSGDTTPSKADITIAQMLEEAGKLLGVKFVDSIIIGSNNYYSMRENNIIM